MITRLLGVAVLLLAVGTACTGEKYEVDGEGINTYQRDDDGDGFSLSDGDCDDADDASYPGAHDVVGDGIDQSCDGIDGVDDDRDGQAWTGSGGDDCDDTDATIYAGAPEIGWDDIDQDCDGEDIHDWLRVACGRRHTCAIDTTGAIQCWGTDNRQEVSGRPTGGPWEFIEAGDHFTCALAVDGTLACWGDDAEGQVSGAPGGSWEFLGVGHEHACVVDAKGDARCWGLDLDDQVTGPNASGHSFTEITAGERHTCAIKKSDGTILCWGQDGAGQADPPPQDGFLRVEAGDSHTCAIRSDQGADCWGQNAVGQAEPSFDPGPYVQMSAKAKTTCAVDDRDVLRCWGMDALGQVSEAPEEDHDFVAIGFDHGCAIHSITGVLTCWGRNDDGEGVVP